jgi:EAL domain-containing protein (putative c-di-GMP-specific phosphodiesterase class I)
VRTNGGAGGSIEVRIARGFSIALQNFAPAFGSGHYLSLLQPKILKIQHTGTLRVNILGR